MYFYSYSCLFLFISFFLFYCQIGHWLIGLTTNHISKYKHNADCTCAVICVCDVVMWILLLKNPGESCWGCVAKADGVLKKCKHQAYLFFLQIFLKSQKSLVVGLNHWKLFYVKFQNPFGSGNWIIWEFVFRTNCN